MLLFFQVKYKVLIITAEKLCRINLQNAIEDDYSQINLLKNHMVIFMADYLLSQFLEPISKSI
jgi:hypothetical protein